MLIAPNFSVQETELQGAEGPAQGGSTWNTGVLLFSQASH